MSEWLDKVKAKVTGKTAAGASAPQQLLTTVSTDYEINLVPAVKAEMIKIQKIRNLVLFICIVVSAAAVGAVVVLFGIKSGQDIAMTSQDNKLENLSSKLLGYDELTDLVSIQGQLDNLSKIADQKKMLSRVFGALGVMLPRGGDSVSLSNLRVDMSNSSLRMEGQADAGVAPFIDYRVLESFKKGVALTKYDYGRYVDADGKEIPSQCIREADADGVAYRDGESYYAWWDLTMDGCEARPKGSSSNSNKNNDGDKNNNQNNNSSQSEDQNSESDASKKSEAEFVYAADAEVEKAQVEVNADESEDASDDQGVEDGGGEVGTEEIVARVKIWRTPQFDKWYLAGNMTENGEIEGIEHFQSQCIKYSGTSNGNSNNSSSNTNSDDSSNSNKKSNIKWSSSNDCMLAPDGLDVTESSNGRNESNGLVLRFVANTTIKSEFFDFRNKHMIAIGPLGQNVTDSYVQIGGMFTQGAKECDENDLECLNNTENSSSGSGSTSNSDKDSNNTGGSSNGNN